MTKKEYMDLTGEDPEDMFGPDWENELEELDKDEFDPRREYQDQEIKALKKN